MRRREPEGGRWLYLLVLLEFQSTVDRTMAVRILAYTALLFQDLLRVVPPEPLPSVLPIVLYHGRAPWTAPEDVAGLSSACSIFLAPYQPAQRYFLFDVGGYTGPLPEGRNLMAALIRLEHSRTPQDVAAVFETLAEWLSGPEHEGLRRAFVEWIRQVHVPARGSARQRPVLDEEWSEGETMRRVLSETVNEWTARWLEEGRVEGRAEGKAEGRIEGKAEGRAEGKAEGRSEGRAEVVCRMAARKFDSETAERLAGRLAGVADPERIVEVGEWLLECEDGDELLEQVAGLCGTPVAAGNPSPS